MTFSRILTKQKAIDKQIYRDKLMAKNKCNTDFNTAHPDECRDANSNNYTKLVKRVTEAVTKKQQRNETFRSKLHANPFMSGVEINDK